VKKRVVRPEILDTLSPDDSGAVANRRDLRFLNRFMGNWAWIGRTLGRIGGAGTSILEAGAGEGDLARFLLRKGIVTEATDYTGLDLWARPADWPRRWNWNRCDLLETQFSPAPDVFVANLLLHQFEDESLKVLGDRLAAIPHWVLCEPLRVRHSIWGLALLRPLGLHFVSWHDGGVSIRAGFRRRELAELLGADGEGRACRVREDPRGSYRLVSWIVK